jgi:energy-converting hydrogenase Eha subunit F
MTLEIIVGLIAAIIIMGLVFAYILSRDQLFPPYQEPVAKEDVQAAWPFPTGKRP